MCTFERGCASGSCTTLRVSECAHTVCACVHEPGGQMCECGCAWGSSTTLHLAHTCASMCAISGLGQPVCVHVCMSAEGRSAEKGDEWGQRSLEGVGSAGAAIAAIAELLPEPRTSEDPGCHPGSGLPRAWPWPSPQRPLLPLGLHARSHRAEQRAEQQRGAPGWVVGGWRWGGRAVRPQAGAWAHGSTGTALAGPRLHSSTQAPVGLREAAGFFLLGNPGRSARPPGRPEASWTFLRGGMSEAPARSLKAISPPELTACGGLRLGAGHSRCAPATEKGLRSSPHHADQGHPTCCSPRRADPGPYWLCGGVGGFPPRTVRRSQDSPPKQDRSL